MSPPELELEPARPGGPVLIYAVSGLGKTTLRDAYPEAAVDADEFLYAAVARAFPDLEPRARLMEWRVLCRSKPWVTGGDSLALWAETRKAFVQPFVGVMRGTSARLVVTSLRAPPWVVSAWYGVERGRYMEHLALAGRLADNDQSEAKNDRLDGHSPVVRLAPGEFLGQREELLRLVSSRVHAAD